MYNNDVAPPSGTSTNVNMSTEEAAHFRKRGRVDFILGDNVLVQRESASATTSFGAVITEIDRTGYITVENSYRTALCQKGELTLVERPTTLAEAKRSKWYKENSVRRQVDWGTVCK
jgi:hypothetical protein